jgi:hypothetical protein
MSIECKQIAVYYTALGPSCGCGKDLDNGETMLMGFVCGQIAPLWIRDFTKGYGVDQYHKCKACYDVEKRELNE